MSGGHWNYSNHEIKEHLCEIGNDGYMIRRFPRLADIMHNLGVQLDDIIHEIDWDFSGDSSIDDDKEFEKKAIKMLIEALALEARMVDK